MLQNLTKFLFLSWPLCHIEIQHVILDGSIQRTYNRNPITLINLIVNFINCEWGRSVERAADLLMKGSD